MCPSLVRAVATGICTEMMKTQGRGPILVGLAWVWPILIGLSLLLPTDVLTAQTQPPKQESKAETPASRTNVQESTPRNQADDAKATELAVPQPPPAVERTDDKRPQRTAGGDMESGAGVTDEEVAHWIDQLGSPSFTTREIASQQLLRVGPRALQPLLHGLADPDPEIQRRARRILGQGGLLEAEHQRRLQLFLSDTQGSDDHDLPGWQRFQALVGKDAEARKLFIGMQRAEAALLASAAAGSDPAAEAIDLRLSQLQSRPRVAKDDADYLYSLAALIFVTADSQLELPAPLLNRAELMNLPRHAQVREALSSGAQQKVMQRLLGKWVLRPSGPQVLQAKLRLALEQQLPEGLELGLRALRQKDLLGKDRFQGIQVISKMGGAKYADLLLPFLDDRNVCARHAVRRNVGNKRLFQVVEIEIRDVVLGWLLFLTKQDHASYNLANAKSAFQRLQKQPKYNLLNISIYFATPEERQAAFKKWDEWIAKNPLPKSPPLPASSNWPAVVAGSPTLDRFGQVKLPNSEQEAALSRLAAGMQRADRSMVQQLDRARGLVESESYGEAALLLGELLTATRGADKLEYGYQRARYSPCWRAVGAEAEWLLDRLPASGLADYELQFGVAARTELEEALKDSSASRLETVSGRYLHTQAGREATLLLGDHLYDCNQPLQAAFVLTRLQGHPSANKFEPALSIKLAICWMLAGRMDKAEDTLKTVEANIGAEKLRVGNRRLSSFEESLDLLRWLQRQYRVKPSLQGYHWSVRGGNAKSNRPSKRLQPYLAGEPLRETLDSQSVRNVVAEIERRQLDEFSGSFPSSSPLVVNGRLLFRTASALRAVDLETGELLWTAPAEDSLNHLLAQPSDESLEKWAGFLRDGLARRMWDNRTYGSLSSDGNRVFALEGLAFGKRGEYQRLVVTPNGQRRLDADGVKAYNGLSAFDVETGKLLWEAGGPNMQGDRSLSGTYFLGPPLPIGNRIFVVGMRNGEAHLLELDSQTGDLVWGHGLTRKAPAKPPTGSVVEWGPRDDDASLRRGQTPAFSDGVLVCPTHGDTYVGMNLSLRRVAWTFEPPRDHESQRLLAAINVRQRHLYEPTSLSPGRGWGPSPITIAQGRVLLAPPEAEALFCLDLTSGAVVWRTARRDGLFVAGVTKNDVVLVVGRGSFWGLSLKDGRPAWSTASVALPAGSTPSGRGYLGGSTYYLPLSTREVAAIDVDRGLLVSRIGSPTGNLPGNLIPTEDAVLSQASGGVWKFETLERRGSDLAVRLEEDPTDAVALTELGELALYRGKVGEAIANLRDAYAIEPNPQRLRMLKEALLEGIRTDFQAHREIAKRIAPQLESEGEDQDFIRQLAEAYRRAGEVDASLDQYLKLLEQTKDERELTFVAAGHRVRSDRWLQARLRDLYVMADERQKVRFRERVEGLRDELSSEDLLHFFGYVPGMNATRLDLARSLGTKKDWLNAEQTLRDVLNQGPNDQFAASLGELAELMRKSGQNEAAARLYARLRDDWPDTEVRPGVTGQALVESVPDDSVAKSLLDGQPVWPHQYVTSNQSNKTNKILVGFPLEMQGRSPLDSRTKFFVHSAGGKMLLAADDWGRKRRNVDLGSTKNQWGYTSNLFSYSQGRLRGNLLTAWLGNRVVGVNLFAENGGRLWSIPTLTSKPPRQRMPHPAALRRRVARAPHELPGLEPSHLAASRVAACFIQDDRLTAVDPLNGDVLWSRDGFSEECDLITDGLKLYVTPPRQTDARVLSMMDGSDLGTCQLPSLHRRIAIRGRRIVTWDQLGEGIQLRMIDPQDGHAEWSKMLPRKASPALASGNQLVVGTPDGEIQLIDLENGKTVWSADVEQAKRLEGIYVVDSSKRMLLILNTPADQLPEAGPQRIAFSSSLGNVSVDGHVVAVDRGTGKQLWSQEVRGQMLNLHQPSEVPVLTFLSHFRSVVNNRARSTSKILCLDSRTGKTLFESSTNNYNTTFEQVADAKKQQVTVRTTRFTVTLSFTDQPPKPKEVDKTPAIKASEDKPPAKKPTPDTSDEVDDIQE